MMGNINQVNPIKLLVINDSTIFREMIRSLLIPYRDVKMIASAPNPVMGIEKINCTYSLTQYIVVVKRGILIEKKGTFAKILI